MPSYVALASLLVALTPPAQSDRARVQPCKYEQNCECAAPGITLRWKASYCMALNETDDLEQDGVQRCLAQQDPASVNRGRPCEQNAYWKARLCGVLHKRDQRAIESCVRDNTMIPRFVETGPGGAPGRALPVQSERRGLYDADSHHLWNRLHRLLFVRVGRDGQEYGEDELDPLLWEYTTHLLSGRSHAQAVALLDEFLTTHAERLISDPVKRAVFQHDLWMVFDWAVRDGGSDKFADARAALTTRLARVIRRVSLTKAQMQQLPDNYRAAVSSHAFAAQPAGGQSSRAFLPPDLFDTNSEWLRISLGAGGSMTPIHSEFLSQSDFSVFLSVPGGRTATQDYLNILWNFPQPYLSDHPFPPDHEQRVSLNPALPRFPAATRVALVRKMLLIDNAGSIVVSNLTESVQLRIFGAPPPEVRIPSGDQTFFEFRMARRKLFGGDAGGLHAVERADHGFLTFSAMPFDPFEGEPPRAGTGVILDGCVACHSEANVLSLRSALRLVKPYSLFDYRIARLWETGARLKARRSDFGVLRGLWQANPR